MATIDPKDWQTLLHQTNDLVAMDFQHFPKVDRNIQQLQTYAGSLRARTNKFRTLNNQIAATRLLAQQGFDANRRGPCTRVLDDGAAMHPLPCVRPNGD